MCRAAQIAIADSTQRERVDGRRAAESLRQFPASPGARHARTRPPRGMPSPRTAFRQTALTTNQDVPATRATRSISGSSHGGRACRGHTGWRRPYGARRTEIRKASEAIHRREFVPRDKPIGDVGISNTGACHDGKRASWVLLAAGAAGYERRELSRRAESAADVRYARGMCGRQAGLKTRLYNAGAKITTRGAGMRSARRCTRRRSRRRRCTGGR